MRKLLFLAAAVSLPFTVAALGGGSDCPAPPPSCSTEACGDWMENRASCSPSGRWECRCYPRSEWSERDAGEKG